MLGQRNRPHLLEAWGARFNVQLEDNLAVFRYRDVPGMIGLVGTLFGESGVNIRSAAVGVEEPADQAAVMVVTTDGPVPQDLIDEIAARDDFHDARAVSL